MSKQRFKKSPFDAPSKTYEKYVDSLDKSKSEETSQPLEDAASSITLSGTDASLPDDAVPDYKESMWEPPAWLKNIATYIAVGLFIFGIIAFFWNMNASVNDTKKDVLKVTERIGSVETAVGNLAKEDTERHSDIKRYIIEMLGKFDRLFDRLPYNQNQNANVSTFKENSKDN